MANYFRITAYHPTEDVGMFSALLVSKGFKILAVGNETKFSEGNIPKAEESDKLFLRACMKGNPEQNGSVIEVNGKSYEMKT